MKGSGTMGRDTNSRRRGLRNMRFHRDWSGLYRDADQHLKGKQLDQKLKVESLNYPASCGWKVRSGFVVHKNIPGASQGNSVEAFS